MENKIYKERITCRLCGNSLENVIDLGDIYLNDFVDDGEEIVSAPLTLVRCTQCELVQLRHTSDLDRLYRQYWYKSSLNKGMIVSLQDIVNNIEKKVSLYPKDTVIDIGCNDGTMLSQYHNPLITKIGFDPALNLKSEAEKHCDIFYNTYFGDVSITTPKAKVITSIAMFYDLEDPHTFVELVKRSLSLDGIWVVQFTDLLSMMKANAFDTICHEHLEYYSFKVLYNLFAQHGLDVFDVSTNDVNGGSVRIYICYKDQRAIELSVQKFLADEQKYMDSFTDPFKAFAERVEKIKKDTKIFIETELSMNKVIHVMGASTKGNTLLQYFGIDHRHIRFAAEVNADKFGKKTVATNIPIISEAESIAMNPDYYLVLPWHFRKGLLQKHKVYLDNGGRFIFPCPNFDIVYHEE
jgi:hypothetical protein